MRKLISEKKSQWSQKSTKLSCPHATLCNSHSSPLIPAGPGTGCRQQSPPGWEPGSSFLYSWAHSQAPGGGACLASGSRPWAVGGGKGCPADSLAPSPTSELPIQGGKKGTGLFLHSCFLKLKLPRGVWTRVKFSAVPKPINALLAASGLHLLPIQPGSSSAFLKLFYGLYLL